MIISFIGIIKLFNHSNSYKYSDYNIWYKIMILFTYWSKSCPHSYYLRLGAGVAKTTKMVDINSLILTELILLLECKQ